LLVTAVPEPHASMKTKWYFEEIITSIDSIDKALTENYNRHAPII
jgi:hypothetical protein